LKKKHHFGPLRKPLAWGGRGAVFGKPGGGKEGSAMGRGRRKKPSQKKILVKKGKFPSSGERPRKGMLSNPRKKEELGVEQGEMGLSLVKKERKTLGGGGEDSGPYQGQS